MRVSTEAGLQETRLPERRNKQFPKDFQNQAKEVRSFCPQEISSNKIQTQGLPKSLFNVTPIEGNDVIG